MVLTVEGRSGMHDLHLRRFDPISHPAPANSGLPTFRTVCGGPVKRQPLQLAPVLRRRRLPGPAFSTIAQDLSLTSGNGRPGDKTPRPL